MSLVCSMARPISACAICLHIRRAQRRRCRRRDAAGEDAWILDPVHQDVARSDVLLVEKHLQTRLISEFLASARTHSASGVARRPPTYSAGRRPRAPGGYTALRIDHAPSARNVATVPGATQ